MASIILHYATLETPEESRSDNSTYCHHEKCRNQIDKDEDFYHLVETPAGDIALCGIHHRPYLMCACGECDLPLDRLGPGHYRTEPGVTLINGKLYSQECAACMK